jgi:hypothetical protein
MLLGCAMTEYLSRDPHGCKLFEDKVYMWPGTMVMKTGFYASGAGLYEGCGWDCETGVV